MDSLKRGREDQGVEPHAKRQASLASFFRPVNEPKLDKLNVTEDVATNTVKVTRLAIEHKDNSQLLHLKSNSTDEEEDLYPPYDHPAYRPPPNPRYNHPFLIPPPTFSLNFNTTWTRIIKKDPDLDLMYISRFIDPSCTSKLKKYLLESMPWYRVKYTVRGISINTPRWTTVFGKDSSSTPWEKGYKCRPRAIPAVLLTIMRKEEGESDLCEVEEVTGETYNFALVNYYASGSDSISYHSDSEHFLGSQPCIASLSLGAPRDFFLRHLKHKELGNVPIEKFLLHDGDMVVMRGRTQEKWEHSIPKRAKAEGRINITFRKAILKYGTENYNQYNVGGGAMYRWVNDAMIEQ